MWHSRWSYNNDNNTPLFSTNRRRTIAERWTCVAVLLMCLRYFIEAWLHGVPLSESTPMASVIGTKSATLFSLPFSYDRAWDIGVFGIAVGLLAFFIVTDSRLWGRRRNSWNNGEKRPFVWEPARGALFALVWSFLGFIATINFFLVQAGVQGQDLLFGLLMGNLFCLAGGCLWYASPMSPCDDEPFYPPDRWELLGMTTLLVAFTFVLHLTWANTPTAALAALNVGLTTTLGFGLAFLFHQVIIRFLFTWLIGGILRLAWNWGISIFHWGWRWLLATDMNGDYATDP